LKPARPVRKRPEGKARVVKTVKTSRAGSTRGAKAKTARKKASGAPVTKGPRPSQRGFKWPSTGE
jgi:hypothetical protein